MQLTNEQKIRVIENYNNIKNHIKTNKELIDILSIHLKIKKCLLQHEINIYNANNQNITLNSKINKL